MNLTKIGTLGILLVGGVLWAVRADAQTQPWQDVWQDYHPAAAASSDQWRPAGQAQTVQPVERLQPTAQRWVSPRNVRTASYEPDSMEVVKTPQGTIAPIPQSGSGGEAVGRGTAQFEGMTSEVIPQGDVVMPRRGCSSCGSRTMYDTEMGGQCGECGECEVGPGCPEYELFDGRCLHVFRDLSVFGGVDGFKGPLDRGTNGNFGLNEGLNWAGPLGDPWGCGFQIGANFVQSNFSGAPTFTIGNENNRYVFHAPYRRQVFVTAGIFRRAEVGQIQWGVAFDYLSDDYYEKTDMKQIRSETGYILTDRFEIGYFGAYGLGTERVIDGRLDTTDMFALYVRRNFENGGNGRIWAGATGYGDGLLGADLWIPLGGNWALENRANYMIPKQGASETGQPRETWGLVMQLVWYPGQSANCMARNVYRPLFGVADNSLFMVDRLAD